MVNASYAQEDDNVEDTNEASEMESASQSSEGEISNTESAIGL